MGPAIALRLRQHLTLTPQVQQALRLLQMSALEFAQEMDQALAANPFLEENSETPAAPREATTTTTSSLDEVVVPQEAPSPGVSDREQEDWSSVSDLQPTLRDCALPGGALARLPLRLHLRKSGAMRAVDFTGEPPPPQVASCVRKVAMKWEFAPIRLPTDTELLVAISFRP